MRNYRMQIPTAPESGNYLKKFKESFIFRVSMVSLNKKSISKALLGPPNRLRMTKRKTKIPSAGR